MFRLRTRPKAILVAAVAGALLAVVCPGRPASADDTLTVVTGAASTGLFDLIEDVAQGAGFYRDAHLNVIKEYSAGSGTAAQLVASGKADVCVLAFDPILSGYDKGLHLQAFLSRQSRYSYVLAVLADSPVRTLSDLKGKTIGEPIFGGASEALMRSILGGAGLKPSDYGIIPIGYSAANLEAVVSRRVDATVDIFSNLITNEMMAHVAYRIFRDPILDGIPNVGFAALPSTIETKSDVLARFSRAIVKAAVFVRADPQAAARIYLQVSGQKITGDLLANTTRNVTLLEGELPAADPANRRIGLVSPSGLQRYSGYLVQYGFMRQPIPGNVIATDRFIAYANDFDRAPVEALAHKMETDRKER